MQLRWKEFNTQNDLLYAQDKTYSAGQIPPVRAFRYITPEFLKVEGTPLMAGRDFTWTDIYEMRLVALVSEEPGARDVGLAGRGAGQASTNWT